MRPDKPGKAVCFAAIFILLLTGCGHKGPLMLPAKTMGQPASASAALPASQPNK